MATGVLAKAAELVQAPKLNMPDWASNPASADLGSMAGTMQGPTSYTPSSDALVADRLGKLLDGGSDYLTRVRTRAAQAQNAMGTLNSSMAIGAGEAAAIDAALPIAQQDASTYATSQRDNAQAANQFASDANAFARQGTLAKFQAATTMADNEAGRTLQRQSILAETARSDADRQQQADTAAAQLAADTAYRTSDLALRDKTATADAELRGRGLDIQQQQVTNDAAKAARDEAFRQTQLQQQARTALANNIQAIREQASRSQAAIETDPNMSAEAKTRAITDLSNKAAADIGELVRMSGVNMPDAWPDWINTVGTSANPSPAAAPSPAPAPAPSSQPVFNPYEGQGGFGP